MEDSAFVDPTQVDSHEEVICVNQESGPGAVAVPSEGGASHGRVPTVVRQDLERLVSSRTQSPVSASAQFVSRVADHGASAAPFVRRVALVPGSPDSAPRSIQDLSRSSNRFSVLADQDDVNREVGASSDVVQTVPASAQAVAMDDGDTDTLVSEVAGSESEAGSDTETEESDTESVQSIIRREEEDRAVPQVVEVEVPEARMTPGIREGLASLDTARHAPFVLGAGSPPKFLRSAYRSALRIALREICHGATQNDEDETDPRLETVGVASKEWFCSVHPGEV